MSSKGAHNQMNTLDLFRLDGKTAIVTGGGRGLGRYMAEALSDAGANLALATALVCWIGERFFEKKKKRLFVPGIMERWA